MDLKNINLDLKNITLESIKAKIQSIDKKILIKFGIGFASIVIFLIIYYAVLSPIVDKKKAQLDNMQKKQAEILKMNKEIKSSKAKIKKLTPRYEQYSTLFHSKAEVEGLYNTLSVFAGDNDLVISKIEKKEIKQVSKAAALESVSKSKKKKKKKKRKKGRKKERKTKKKKQRKEEERDEDEERRKKKRRRKKQEKRTHRERR